MPGYQFVMTDSTNLANNDTYTVEWSLYCTSSSSGLYTTQVKVVETFQTPVDGIFVPLTTSLGDEFTDLHQHWLFDGLVETRSVDPQPINPMLPFSIFPPPTPDVFPAESPNVLNLGTYVVGNYAQEISLTTASFGTYTISGVSFSPNTWIVEGNHADVINHSSFNIDTLVVRNNTGGANGNYTIVNATNVGLTTEIEVLETIAAEANADGTAYVQWTLTFDSNLYGQTRYQTNELRVYVDDVRDFNYEEINAGSGTSSPPLITSTCDDLVQSIIIQRPIEQFSLIRIEVGAAAHVDIGWENIVVRTVEDDLTFNPLTDLECVSVVRYRKLEQVKSTANQYPLFDLFDVEGESINEASRVFGFHESQDAPIDPFVNRRIVYTDDRRSYSYEQFLTPEDNGILYAYRDSSIRVSGGFWFETDNEVLYRWTGSGWDPKVLTSAYGSSYCYLTPIVSDVIPGEPWISISGMIWFNTNNNTIYTSDGFPTNPG